MKTTRCSNQWARVFKQHPINQDCKNAEAVNFADGKLPAALAKANTIHGDMVYSNCTITNFNFVLFMRGCCYLANRFYYSNMKNRKKKKNTVIL